MLGILQENSQCKTTILWQTAGTLTPQFKGHFSASLLGNLVHKNVVATNISSYPIIRHIAIAVPVIGLQKPFNLNCIMGMVMQWVNEPIRMHGFETVSIKFQSSKFAESNALFKTAALF